MGISDRKLESANGPLEQTMSEAILTAVAEREGVDVYNLQTPLFDSIDPDALEALFRNSSGQVTFEYRDYLITVDTDRNVALSKTTGLGHSTQTATRNHSD
jgi:hypothetical protein